MSSIRIKMGALEIEFEGSEEFLKDDFLNLLDSVINLRKRIGTSDNEDIEGARLVIPETLESSNGSFSLTTRNIASRLGMKKGSDLVISAVASLTLSMGRETFSRQDILDEMKTATTYYKLNHNKNLSRYLDQLVKQGKLNEIGQNKFALSEKTKSELEMKLGIQ